MSGCEAPILLLLAAQASGFLVAHIVGSVLWLYREGSK